MSNIALKVGAILLGLAALFWVLLIFLGILVFAFLGPEALVVTVIVDILMGGFGILLLIVGGVFEVITDALGR